MSKPEPSVQAGAREHAEEWLRNHGNSWLIPHADLFTAYNVHLAQQLEALRAALKKYGQHGHTCYPMRDGCTCGLDAALKAAQETDDKQYGERWWDDE